MKTILQLLIGLFIGLAIAACSNELPKENSEYITMWVSAETTTVYDEWLDADMECMLVRFSPHSEWEPMPLGKIQGFSYKKGMEYELIVYRSTPLNGPGTGENFAYRLYKIISKTEKRVVVEGLERY